MGTRGPDHVILFIFNYDLRIITNSSITYAYCISVLIDVTLDITINDLFCFSSLGKGESLIYSSLSTQPHKGGWDASF